MFRTTHPDRYSVLKEHSKRNRKFSTEAESLLWAYLRGKSLGVKFRRQHCIGDFIADFVCLQSLLVIEVDGGYHLTKEQQQEDEMRTQALSKLGFRVIRFTNEQVLGNIDDVILEIESNI